MSPSAEPAELVATADALRAAERMEDGEVILLAVKPSRWFVLLVSWPVLLAAAALTVGAYLLAGPLASHVDKRLVGLVCTAAACSRLTLACLQWQGRLYLLTNRRVMRLRGAFREDVAQCRLKDLRDAHVCLSWPDRLVSTGNLVFERSDDKPVGDIHWLHLSEPAEVQRAVRDAWSRAR